MKTYCDVVNEYKSINLLINDLETSLRELRDNRHAWEKDIDKDDRPSVQLLYGSLKNHRSKLEAFMKVEIYNHPGEVLNGL